MPDLSNILNPTIEICRAQNKDCLCYNCSLRIQAKCPIKRFVCEEEDCEITHCSHYKYSESRLLNGEIYTLIERGHDSEV